ncbi:type IV pilus modification protein PilV [Variovorax sp. LT1R16]|uniref:type IV pilus modification protein PilV n=1 Tax=Variovorax sp. LT1R16 TaxID=3443728 RepID=UPI003F48EF24
MTCSKRLAGGFSLLEVLVSVLVLSAGLLGAAGMLLTSLRSASESAVFSAAVDLARDLSEKLRANPGIAARNDPANAYLLALGAGDAAPASALACVGEASCTAAQLAAWDVHEWALRVQVALPEARLVVCFDEAFARAEDDVWACTHAGRTLAVKLGWAPRVGHKADGAAPPPRLVMQLSPGHDGDDHVAEGF